MIEIVNVSKQYEAIQALQNIGLTIPEGTCFGLVGPNGAGKSTLMKILSGVLQNFEGDIIVKGHSVMKDRIIVKNLLGTYLRIFVWRKH